MSSAPPHFCCNDVKWFLKMGIFSIKSNKAKQRLLKKGSHTAIKTNCNKNCRNFAKMLLLMVGNMLFSKFCDIFRVKFLIWRNKKIDFRIHPSLSPIPMSLKKKKKKKL
jgi:hypothetical protein